MLIKVLTNLDFTRIIPNVEDVSIVNSCFTGSWNDCIKWANDAPFSEDTINPTINTFDTPQAPLSSDLKYIVNVVFFKQNGNWNKLAVFEGAWVCNDNGKTIHKIGFN